MTSISKDVQHLIDTFDPPHPKWKYEPVPNFSLMKHPELEEDKYWDEQNRRWIEGHYNDRGEYIPGMHYFYMQEGWLSNIDGNIFKPRWRDTDELMSNWCKDATINEESLLIYKRRDVGVTSFFANLSFYYMRVFPGIYVGLTGKDQRNISNMFNAKILLTYNRFNSKVLNTIPVSMNNTQQKSHLTIAMKVYDEEFDIVDTRTSTLLCAETSEKPDSPNNFSGNRFKYVFVDEAALHKRIEPFLSSIFPAINKGPIRSGLLVMAGTIEPTLTSKEVADFYELIERTKNLRVRSEMLPVWMSMFEKNGWSNKEAGMLWYEENRKVFEDAGDTIGLRSFIMQYPKDKDDIFDLSQGSFFESDVSDILSSTYKRRLEEKNEELAYKLVNTGGDVEAIPDTKRREKGKHGGHWIIEMPKNGITYYQAIDGIGTGKKEGAEEGSWIGCIIFKGFDPDGGSFMPVGIYYERPDTIEQGYRQMALQWNFYNKFGGGKEINYEVNASTGDHFGTFLEKQGLYHYTYKRKDLSGKGYINKKKRGVAVNDHTREWQVRQANEFLRRHGMNIKSRLLLESLLKSENENADLRDAFLIFMVSIPNYDKPIEKVHKPRTKSIIKLVRQADGSYAYRSQEVVTPNMANDVEKDVRDAYVAKLKAKYGQELWYRNATDAERTRLKELGG